VTIALGLTEVVTWQRRTQAVEENAEEFVRSYVQKGGQ
jgi:hypothetical protein